MHNDKSRRTTVTKTNDELRQEYFPTRKKRGELESKWAIAVQQNKIHKNGGPEPTVILTEEEKQAVWLSLTTKAANHHFTAFHKPLTLRSTELRRLSSVSQIHTYAWSYDTLVKHILMLAELMCNSSKGLAWAYTAYKFRYRELLHKTNLEWAGFNLTDYEIKHHVRIHQVLQGYDEVPDMEVLTKQAFNTTHYAPKKKQPEIAAASLALFFMMTPYELEQFDTDDNELQENAS